MNSRIVQLVAFVVSLFTSASVFATVPSGSTDHEDWTVTVKSRVWSRYLGTNGAIYFDGPVVQTDMTVGHQSGFYFNAWTSFDAKSLDFNNSFGDEVDFSIGLANTIGSGDAKINFDGGVAMFALYDLGNVDNDVFQAYLELSKPYKWGETTLTPFLRTDCYADTELSWIEPNFEGGLYYNIPLSDSFSFNSRLSCWYDTGVDAFGLESGLIGKAGFDLSYNWSENVTVELLNLKFSSSFVEDAETDDPRGNEFAFGFGIRANF